MTRSPTRRTVLTECKLAGIEPRQIRCTCTHQQMRCLERTSIRRKLEGLAARSLELRQGSRIEPGRQHQVSNAHDSPDDHAPSIAAARIAATRSDMGRCSS